MKTLKEIINNKEAKFRNPRDYEDLGVGGVKYRQRKGAKKKEKKDDVLGYREGSEIEEGAKFSAAQLDKLKAQYSTIQKIDPTGSSYKKMKDMMNRMSKEQLKQIKAAKIKFLQYTAGDLLRKMGEEVGITSFSEFIEINEISMEEIKRQHKKPFRHGKINATAN